MPINHQKITLELCKKNNLMFLLRSEADAAFVKELLVHLGCEASSRLWFDSVWAEETGISLLVPDSLYFVGVSDGEVRGPFVGTWDFVVRAQDFLICSPEQFFINDTPPAASAEMTALNQRFNDMARRIERMESMLQELYEQTKPVVLDKPRLPGSLKTLE